MRSSCGTLMVLSLFGLGACAGVGSGSLAVSPTEAVLKTQEALSFEIDGGLEPYTFEVIQGSGLVSAEARQFVAPNTASTSYVRIRDVVGRESVVVVKTQPASSGSGECNPVSLAVVDSGVDIDHPQLEGYIWTNEREIADNGVDDDRNGFVDDVHGWNFAGGNADPRDDNYHGTHVAGAAAGVAGTGRSPSSLRDCQDSVRLVPVKLFDAYGVTTTSDIVDSLRYAVDSGAQVINASFGARIYASGLPEPLAEILSYVDGAGVALVASAGNYGQDLDRYPIFPASSGYKNILTVAALGSSNRLASFSNYSAKFVGIAAPGEFIESTFPTRVTAGMQDAGRSRSFREVLSGTSVSSPLVAGALSRLWSRDLSLSHEEARAQLFEQSPTVPSLVKAVAGGRRLSTEEFGEP